MEAVLLTTDLALGESDFKYFQEAIYECAGISLSNAKRDLLQSRLRSRIEHLKLGSYKAYRGYLESVGANHEEWQTFINLLTTNKTDFFREPKHFDYLVREYLAKSALKTPLKVWSAACSTGEEPYTLAMVLNKALNAKRDFRILATDIDSSVLAKAERGVYPAARIHEQVPADHIAKSINFGQGEISDWARIAPSLKERVSFKLHNLIEPSYPGDEVFDIIFLRNVLIYFSPETISFVVEKLFKSAKREGLLFIGHTESLNGVSTSWKSVAPSIYCKA